MTQENTNNTDVLRADNKEKVSPPYIPFLTFNNMINWLETEGVPVKFDRSFWGKKYGGTLGLQVMAGLRFLGLLKGDYTQPQLGEIIKTKGDDRKKLLSKMIQEAYSAVDFSQLAGATPNMLKEWFAKYGLDGSTERKARSFFINACKAYDVPLSNILKKTARNKQPGGSREKRIEKEKPILDNKDDNTSIPTQQQIPRDSETGLHDLYKIILTNGCELKLCSTEIFFEMEKADRELIENIVEVMKKYRKK